MSTNSEYKKIKLTDIKPYEKNPRINDLAVDYVVKSIKQCGYISPIIVDENNVILAGHTRYKALKSLGYDEAKCIVKEGLSDDLKKKYRLLDNKTNEYATWDFDLLKDEISDIDFGDLEIDWGIDDISFINDLENDGFKDFSEVQPLDSYSVTFVFPADKKEFMLSKVNELGKPKISDMILEMLEK